MREKRRGFSDFGFQKLGNERGKMGLGRGRSTGKGAIWAVGVSWAGRLFGLGKGICGWACV